MITFFSYLKDKEIIMNISVSASKTKCFQNVSNHYVCMCNDGMGVLCKILIKLLLTRYNIFFLFQ